MNDLLFLCFVVLYKFVVYGFVFLIIYRAADVACKNLYAAYQVLRIRGNRLALLKVALIVIWSIAAFVLLYSILIGFNQNHDVARTDYGVLVILYLLLCLQLYELNSRLLLQLQVSDAFHLIAHHHGKFSAIIHISLHLLYFALVHGKGDVLIGAISAYVLYLATVLLFAVKEDAEHIFQEMIIALVSECFILKLFHGHAPVAHFLFVGAFIALTALCMAVPEGQLVDFRRFHGAAFWLGELLFPIY